MSNIPSNVRRSLDAAEEAIEQFRNARGHRPTTFIQADCVEVYRALRKIAVPGDCFLEWGSGVGIITILAAHLGYRSCGIEIDSELVEISTGLAEFCHTQATFSVGSFVPDEYQWSAESADAEFHTDPGGADGYEALESTLSDFDLIYAYPWPGEEEFFRDIFEQCARPGAGLITYRGIEGIEYIQKPL